MARRVQRRAHRDNDPTAANTTSSFVPRGRNATRDRRRGDGRDDADCSRFTRQRSAADRSAGAAHRAIPPDALGRQDLMAALPARLAGRVHRHRVRDRARPSPARATRRTGDRDVRVVGLARTSRAQARLYSRTSASPRRRATHRQLSERPHDRRDGVGNNNGVRSSPTATHLAAEGSGDRVDCTGDDGRLPCDRRRTLGYRRRRRLAARRRDRSHL